MKIMQKKPRRTPHSLIYVILGIIKKNISDSCCNLNIQLDYTFPYKE